MPYILKAATEEEQWPVMNKLTRGPIMQEATAKAPAISGLRALDTNWFYGMRHLTTGKKQVVKADDLKGMKIRTPDAPLARLPIAAPGAAVTPMSMQEVYSALQMGVVDGQENPIDTIYTAKLYEVQKYITLTGHQVGCETHLAVFPMWLTYSRSSWPGVMAGKSQNKIAQRSWNYGR